MKLTDIKIDEELRNLLPPLSMDEYQGLESDIKKRGVLDPIILWNGMIADGHNRYAVCEHLGIDDVPTKDIDFDSKADVMSWIIDHQFSRRNLTKSQRIRSLEKVREKIAEEARERRISKLKQNDSFPVKKNFSKREDPVHTSEKMAALIGVSAPTYKRMRRIVNEGTPEQIERMDKGGKGNSVNAIAHEISLVQTQDKEIEESIRYLKNENREDDSPADAVIGDMVAIFDNFKRQILLTLSHGHYKKSAVKRTLKEFMKSIREVAETI